MTSRRHDGTPARRRSFLTPLLAVLGSAMMIAGCAALPDDASTVEQLDEQTGLTIARLGRPMELYRETFQRDPAGRLAFLGPFETNRMGTRALYLWIALPLELAPDSAPDVELDGHALELGSASRDAAAAGLRESPYRIPTPWSTMLYYRIGADVIAKLAEAGTLAVRVTEQDADGTSITVFAATVADSRLKDFAAR
jgi:hypothetical protein